MNFTLAQLHLIMDAVDLKMNAWLVKNKHLSDNPWQGPQWVEMEDLYYDALNQCEALRRQEGDD